MLKGSLIYGVVTILSRVAAVILISILTGLLSPDQYGALNIIITAVQLTTLVVTLEIAQAVTFFFNDRNQLDRGIYPSTALWFSLILYVLFFLIVYLFSNSISEYVGEMHISIAMLKSAAFLLGSNGFFFFLQNQLRLEFKAKQYAVLSLFYILFTTVGAILGVRFIEQRVTGVILGQGIGAFIVSLIGIIFISHRIRLGFDIAKLKQMLRFSLPLVPAGLLLLGGQQVPKFILSIYGSLEDVGIYSLASQIAGFSGLATLGVQTAITPSVLANCHHENTPKILGKLFEDFSNIALIFCCFLSVFASELVSFFSTSNYERASVYVPLISFSVVINSLYIFFPGIVVRGKSSLQLLASGGGFFISIIASFILIKLYGLKGAAISSLVSAIAFIAMWYHLSQNLYFIPVRWNLVFRSLGLAVVLCIVTVFILPSGPRWNAIFLKAFFLGLFIYSVANYIIVMFWEKFVKILTNLKS